ncbi:hypothetical protein ACEPAH_3949 [Sanghuangporus vaninii]
MSAHPLAGQSGLSANQLVQYPAYLSLDQPNNWFDNGSSTATELADLNIFLDDATTVLWRSTTARNSKFRSGNFRQSQGAIPQLDLSEIKSLDHPEMFRIRKDFPDAHTDRRVMASEAYKLVDDTEK